MRAEAQQIAGIVIFLLTYAVVAVGRLPGFRLDRPAAAFFGAAAMVGFGVLSPAQAYHAIDMDTIALLLGMMIVVASLTRSGAFRLIVAWAVTRARHPLLLLVAIVLASGVLSAFMVNDTICLVMTPLVLDLVERLRRPPVPYLLAIAMAANIGSVTTITGNPQNMIIGSLSHISYGRFAAALAPVAAVGLVLVVVLIAIVWKSEFFSTVRIVAETPRTHASGPLVRLSAFVMLAMVAGFFAGASPAAVAIVGGAVLLVISRTKPEKFYAGIDGVLLLMFASLFIVVAGVEHAVLTPGLIDAVAGLHLERTWLLTIVTAVLSNIVSNVPAVLVLHPFISRLNDSAHAWLIVAMASTLAGNLTLLGSVANLIVAQQARARGVHISLWAYALVGVPLTLLTLAVGIVLL